MTVVSLLILILFYFTAKHVQSDLGRSRHERPSLQNMASDTRLHAPRVDIVRVQLELNGMCQGWK